MTMKNIHPWILPATLIAGLSVTALTEACPINVLWYTYADPASEYRQKISQLSDIVHTLPQSNASCWNLTYWDAGGAVPNFAAFDVLVIESGEAFRTGPPHGPLATPNYSGILDNKAAIEAARGDRTFITTADSDFHAVRGDTGNIPDSVGEGKCDPVLTSTDCWDGALGHSVNAINWAANGNGLGIVSFLDGKHAGSFWWTHTNSFLHDELNGRVSYGGTEQNPVINPSHAAHPLNYGLTSQGLSDWDNSFHAFILPVDGYTRIVDSSSRPDYAVAIATSAPPPVTPVPEPTTCAMIWTGLGLWGQ